jgi:hypothetical protein
MFSPYESMKAVELRSVCKDKNIKCAKLRKKDMLQAIKTCVIREQIEKGMDQLDKIN